MISQPESDKASARRGEIALLGCAEASPPRRSRTLALPGTEREFLIGNLLV